MTPQEQILAKATYDALFAKAKNLGFMDKAVLLTAFNNDKEFEEIPLTQQRLFLEVGLAGIKALQAEGNL